MAQKMTISIADLVYLDIEEQMKKQEKTNKSEFVEELIRIGLSKIKEAGSDE